MGGNASFSSTLSIIRAGLRSYGSILDDLQGRPDILKRRRPNINSKVCDYVFLGM